MGGAYIRNAGGGVVLQVHVVPRAGRSEIAGLHGGALRIRLNAPPVDGAANEALVDFLSDRLGIPRSRITILSGRTSRVKQVRIDGLDRDCVNSLLGFPCL